MRSAVVHDADDKACIGNALESLVRLTDRENTRRAKTADAFELPQVTKVAGKRSADTLKDARSIMKRQCHQRVLMLRQFSQLDASTA